MRMREMWHDPHVTILLSVTFLHKNVALAALTDPSSRLNGPCPRMLFPTNEHASTLSRKDKKRELLVGNSIDVRKSPT